ncbi:MAG: elongation factor Ts [Planctomycetota bacterium]|jgi:elongation factor Ts
MAIDAKTVKELRESTRAGMMQCKKALADTGGDLEKAKVLLRERGLAGADDMKQREIKSGWIGSFVQNGRVAGLVEVGCNTDFVARTKEFQDLVRELAIGVVAFSPEGLTKDDLPKELIEEEKKKFEEELKGKPPQIQEKIVTGKLEKSLFSQKCLLHMPYPKEEVFKGTYGDLVREQISKLGENITVRRFVRIELGL